ncbi:EAL and HDOD domain-containing protein [Halomonas sp. GT]|uniref:EAL and HDOD domain-containing protein n=1 Tax=Halomonas sp. GT TaxID=1971364 RepID=UPI0018DE2465|nr:HDOD domain-containing protein [Halomonas sp. GT]
MTWLAERVETKAEYEIYYNAGFELFQGYYFAKPSIVYGKVLPPSSLQLTRILSALSNQNVGIGELAEMVSADPNLAVKLLKIANSPLYRGHVPLESVHDVIARLGLDYLRRWMLVFGVLKDSTREHAELILTRAHLCELLTKTHRVRGNRGADAYLVGLMSGVDLLLKIEPSIFIESVNVSNAIADAVVKEAGTLGKQLKLARKIERCVMLKRIDLLEPSWLDLYCQARRHAIEVVKLSETL